MTIEAIETKEQLKALRKHTEKSQADFAELLGVARSTYGNIEIGKDTFSDEMKERVKNFISENNIDLTAIAEPAKEDPETDEQGEAKEGKTEGEETPEEEAEGKTEEEGENEGEEGQKTMEEALDDADEENAPVRAKMLKQHAEAVEEAQNDLNNAKSYLKDAYRSAEGDGIAKGDIHTYLAIRSSSKGFQKTLFQALGNAE